jgi:hypothetical protein
VGQTQTLIKGDYANLSLYLDLNLTDALCGLGGTGSSLCGVASALASSTTQQKGVSTGVAPQSAGVTPATGATSATGATATSPLPALPGSGG